MSLNSLSSSDRCPLYTLQVPPQNNMEVGELIYVTTIYAAHIFKDFREALRGITGGKMEQYEHLMNQAIEQALQRLSAMTLEKGYDGIIGLTLSHPSLVEGGVEVIAYGNGFKYKSDTTTI